MVTKEIGDNGVDKTPVVTREIGDSGVE